MPSSRVPRALVLGGSTEAYELAAKLDSDSFSVITSLAGRTTRPRMPAGGVRVGGFGGPEGLARYLVAESIEVVVDATHPFTRQMPHNAQAACDAVSIPRLRLRRAAWRAQPGDRWTAVAGLEAAATQLGRSGARRVLLTTGRQELAPFAELGDCWFLVRAIEMPDPQPLANAEVLLARGPFDLESELALLRRWDVDTVVTKNSGGDPGRAKLEAARMLSLPVVMVDRPADPPGACVESVAEAVSWCQGRLGRV